MVPDAGSGGTFNTAGQGAEAAAGSAAGKSNQAGMAAAAAGAGMGAADGGSGGVTMVGASAGTAGGTSQIPGSSGCGMDPPAADMDRIQVSGISASYTVDVPPNYDKTRPYPLVIAFRGSNVTVEQFRGDLNLPQVAGAEAILVHPNSLGGAFSWDVQRDVPLFDMLITRLGARYCVDERRAFAVGHEIGGYFASMLGCLRADKLRGIAAISPGVPPTSTCQGEVAVWIAQGNAESPVALSNGRSTSDFWARRSGCDAEMSSAVDPSPCQAFAGCDPGFPIRYCEYSGGLDLPPFAASGIWSFFKSL